VRVVLEDYSGFQLRASVSVGQIKNLPYRCTQLKTAGPEDETTEYE
jgi:hypothetical protein